MRTLLKTVALLGGRLTVNVYNEDNKSFYLTFRFIRQSSLTLTTQLYIDGTFKHGVLSGFSNSNESNLTLNIEEGLYAIASRNMEFRISLYNTEKESEDYGTDKFQITDLKLNSYPIISSYDTNLGDKNTGFSIIYQVNDSDNDILIITETLNGNVLRTLNNAPKGQDLIISISNEQLYKLPLNQQNTITIQADDGKGGISYRNYTFRRTNTAPIINGVDTDLGILTTLSKDYTVTDAENNPVTVVEKIDNMVLRNYSPTLGANNTLTISKDAWIQLLNGQHKVSIEATDSNGSKTIRTYTFTKADNVIKFELKTPFTTDVKANKILVTPVWNIKDANVKVEVCNNAFDVNPTWEDCTSQVLINRHFNFTNITKTAAKWGINIRITLARKDGTTSEIFVKGFGGAFE